MNYSHPVLRSWIVVLASLCVSHASAAQTDTSFTEDVEKRVIALTNDLRKEHGLQPLQPDSRLTQTARSFAAYVAKTDKLDHDADGSTPPDRAKKSGYNFCIIAENLANEYRSEGFTPESLSRNFVQGWRESASHRENMLQPDVTEIGVGVAQAARSGEYYAVQMLARPLSQTVKFRVTNGTAQIIRYQYRGRGVEITPKQVRAHASCVAGELTFEWPGKQQPSTLRPKDGDRYIVLDAGRGTYRVAQEK